MRPDLTRIVDAFQDHLVQFTRKLIQTRSLPGEEQAVAALVQAEMEKLGYDRVWRDRAGNVIGLMQGQAGGASLMLNSHMDHVDVGDESKWPYPPYAGVVAGDFIWGRGACDGKGALAVQVYAPALARKGGLSVPRDVYTTAVVLEERGGWGASQLVQEVKTDCAILGQASRNELRNGHRGRLELLVHYIGRSVHASVPARGANPHYAMARFLMRLHELRMVSDGVLGHSTVSPTIVKIDQTSPNVTPGEIWLTLDWRNIPSESPQQIVTKVQKLVEECLEPGVRATTEVPHMVVQTYAGAHETYLIVQPGYYLPDSNPFVSAARTILAGALEREIEVTPWAFATDGGHLMSANIPTMGFAPGQESFAHTIQDRVAIAELRESAVGYLALLENLT
jgi:succinyl-diaminopimelate desuccinylase